MVNEKFSTIKQRQSSRCTAAQFQSRRFTAPPPSRPPTVPVTPAALYANDLHRLYWSDHWPIRKIERR
jgi:hypothetical protein